MSFIRYMAEEFRSTRERFAADVATMLNVHVILGIDMMTRNRVPCPQQNSVLLPSLLVAPVVSLVWIAREAQWCLPHGPIVPLCQPRSKRLEGEGTREKIDLVFCFDGPFFSFALPLPLALALALVNGMNLWCRIEVALVGEWVLTNGPVHWHFLLGDFPKDDQDPILLGLVPSLSAAFPLL